MGAVAGSGGGRRRRWWLALLLNLILFPTGYAYAGARWLAAIAVVLALLIAVLVMAWTYAYPPGFFGLGMGFQLVAGSTFGAAVGIHAAWLARKAALPRGSAWKRSAINLSFWLALIGGALALRMLLPVSTYSMASSSMEPSLRVGDIVAVRGMQARCGGARPVPGDVVVYRRPGGSSAHYMGRVVAGPGQSIALQDGRVLVDGEAVAIDQVDEITLAAPGLGFIRKATRMRETLRSGASYNTLDLGPGRDLDTIPLRRLTGTEWFVLGDNRDNSADSRVVGPIASEDICGIALRILQSEDKSRVGAKP
jgi:signal peptidase I